MASVTLREAGPSADGAAGEAQTLAAVDLGSNSFHMIVARVRDGHLEVVDRLRDVVRLASGLDEEKRLRRDAVERAMDCLQRFGQRLRDMPPHTVRVVGTNTLRIARNAPAFIREAERVLGHRIEVIAGREEARLIHLGVAHALADQGERRLVIDIGGGSTELIVGLGFSPLYRESLYMGCVSMSNAHFGAGVIDKAAFKAAEIAAHMELEPVREQFRAADWRHAVGCSGTIKAIGAIVRAAGWSKHGITRDGLDNLRREMIAAGHVDKLALRELKEERRPVLAGGVAVLRAAFEALGIESLEVSEMALREGVLFDLLGRIRHDDVRAATVARIAERFHVDAAQADRVATSALELLDRAAGSWALGDEETRKALEWAARLHEIGLIISHSQYHKHGAYLLGNADMSGFSREEQALLGALVRGHRRKFPVNVFERFSEVLGDRARRLCVLLRIAVVLNRPRSGARVPQPQALAAGETLALTFPEDWLSDHPLTRADLEQEAGYLAAAGFTLEVS